MTFGMFEAQGIRKTDSSHKTMKGHPKGQQLESQIAVYKPPDPYHPWDWYIYLHLVDFYGKCW